MTVFAQLALVLSLLAQSAGQNLVPDGGFEGERAHTGTAEIPCRFSRPTAADPLREALADDGIAHQPGEG